MAISKKRVPPVKDAEIAKAISKIYDDLNEVINAVNEGDSTEAKETKEGKSGDIRVVKDGEGKYFIEAKADEGWLRTIPGVMQFRTKLDTTIDAVTALDIDEEEVDLTVINTTRLNIVEGDADTFGDISDIKFWVGRDGPPSDPDDVLEGFGVGINDAGTNMYFEQDEPTGSHYVNFHLNSPTSGTKFFKFYINGSRVGHIDSTGWHDG